MTARDEGRGDTLNAAPPVTADGGAGSVASRGRLRRFAVTALTVTDFRNYDRARIETGGDTVVLTGVNGAGKTNLLEAISFLAPGRGLRRARLTEVERRRGIADAGDSVDGVALTGAGWAVAAEVETPDGPNKIGTGRDPQRSADSAEATERRVVRIDGVAAPTQTALAELGQVIWLTPDMDRLFLDGASGRRRFLDRLVYGFAPDHASRLSAYEKAMRERSRLLRDRRFDPAWLNGLEAAMAEHGVAVAAARREVLAQLARACAMGITGFPVPAIAIEGVLEASLGDRKALDVEDAFRAELAAARPRDAEAGRALSGPHRSDLVVHLREKDMPAAACSTGEQKALLVAIVLAAARLQTVERGATPILLFDEIAAHLDAGRRAALFDEIGALGAQAWMTGTDASLFDALAGRARFFGVAAGEITPQDVSE